MKRDAETIARSYLGTPFQHQGRVPSSDGVVGGLDCAGLVICVGRELGHVPKDFDLANYAQQPDKTSILKACDQWLVKVPVADMRPGHVVVIAWDSYPQHLAVVGSYRMRKGELTAIHAFARPGEKDARVVEHRIIQEMRRQIKHCYRFPEVAKWPN